MDFPISLLQGIDVMAIVHAALAAFQLGSLFTWGLHGVLSVQVYNYYLSFPKDPTSRKVLVYSVWILETLQLVLVTRDTFQIFAHGFGNILVINKLQLLPLSIPILGGTVGLICHLMFAYRIMLISQSRLIGFFISALALCSGASAFAFGGRLFAADTLFNVISHPSQIYLACGLWNGFGAGCDAVIAVCMTYYLSRRPTGFRKTDLVITRIIRLTIETGIVTATASVASVTLFVGFQKNPAISVYFVLPAVAIAKMYSITILATFNNRPHAVGGPPDIPDTENGYGMEARPRTAMDQRKPIKEILIGRTVEKQVWSDDSDVPTYHADVFKADPERLTSDTQSSSSSAKDLAPESFLGSPPAPTNF